MILSVRCSTPQQELDVKEQLDQLLLSLSEQEQVMLTL